MTFWPRVWERILSNNQPQVRVYTHKMMISHMSHMWQWILWHTSNPAKLRYEHDWVRWHNQWAKTYSKTLTVRILIFQTHKREHCWIQVEFKMDGIKLYDPVVQSVGPTLVFLSVQIDAKQYCWCKSQCFLVYVLINRPLLTPWTVHFGPDLIFQIWLLSRYCISNRRLKL